MAAVPDGRSSIGLDNRASMGNPARFSLGLYGNDDDLGSFAIADGSRPAESTASGPITSLVDRPLGRRTPPPRPLSTTKPKAIDSFALQHDGATGNLVGGPSSSTAMRLNRSSSASTGTTVARTESSYQGPARPSHPYQMYPQESRLARTASTATASTVPVPPERSYSGPNGPTHPYMMYPQSTVSASESSHEQVPMEEIPVGFPGRINNYQRRLGPDGEEVADIIGPDGHTEQLPPYSQYPDEAVARKTRPAVPIPVSGAGGMGLATRNPEFASRDDLNSPQSRQSTRSLISDSDGPEVNIAAQGTSEKPPLKKWQIVARRRVCGILPIWAIALTVVIFILFGIILGTVLALLKPKHSQKHHDVDADAQSQSQGTTVYASMTTTFDAKPFTTVPSGIQSLATGTYGLPISAPTLSQSSCILNSAQSIAWSCSMPQVPLEITVNEFPGSSPLKDNEMMINNSNESAEIFQYRAQPPILSQSQVLNLVTDNQEPWRGPAWFFQIPYNKIVNLPEGALAPPVDNEKRNSNSPSAGDFMRRGVAQPGEKPWVCYWNGTLLEAFIYINQTTGTAPSSSSSSSAAATSSSSASVSKRSSDSSDSDPEPPNYPQVVKVEERRVPRGAQTIPQYCVQHIIHSDGTASPYMNSTNQPMEVYLNETEPTTVTPISGWRLAFLARFKERDMGLEKRQSGNNCGCVWLAT